MRVKLLIMCAAFFASSAFAASSGRSESPKPTVTQANRVKLGSSVSRDLPSWEFRTAPIAMAARWLTLDVSHRFSAKFASGPALIAYAASSPGGMLAPSYNGYAAGWSANYYFASAFTSGWYLSAHAYYESYESYPHASRGYKVVEGFKANSALGYRWKIRSFDLLAGVGIENRTYSVVDHRENLMVAYAPAEQTNSNESNWLPFFEFKVGFEI